MSDPEKARFRLIVGWSRGGLGYVAQLLRLAGQQVGYTFDEQTTEENVAERAARCQPFEVSPFVVPFLNRPELRQAEVLFLARDPMRVLNSLYFLGLLHGERPSAVERYAFRHLPEFEARYRGKPAQAGCSYLNQWLRLAVRQREELAYLRLENGPQTLLQELQVPVDSPPYCPPYVNSSGCIQKIVPSQLPEQQREGMKQLLIQLGYYFPVWLPRGGHAHFINPDWHS